MNVLTRENAEIAVGGLVGLALGYVAYWHTAVPDWVGVALFLGFGIVGPALLRDRRHGHEHPS